MVAKPRVQTLSQAMTDLNPAYSGQTALINQQKAGLGAKYGAQKAALTAEKGLNFNAINNQATGRGGSFSGIPIDEQATYLSTKYLPGLQQADYQMGEERMGFQKEIAGLNSEKRLQALGRIDKQKSDLNSWNMAAVERKARAREAEKQRQFQASQSALERAATASNAALSRAQSSAQQGPSNSSIIKGMNTWASKRWGGDKKLSPSDFKGGYQQFVKMGGGAVSDYVAIMQRYINGSHKDDYAFK